MLLFLAQWCSTCTEYFKLQTIETKQSNEHTPEVFSSPVSDHLAHGTGTSYHLPGMILRVQEAEMI